MSSPPAILQVLPRLDAGGVERGTLEIAEAIQAAGYRALVASAGGRLVPALEALGARHISLPLATKSPLGIWRNAGALAGLVRAEGIAILHARSRAPAWSAWLAARRTGADFVTTYHGTYGEGFPGKRLYNSVMARGDRVIAISRHIAAHIQGTHGVTPRLIPRGVDLRQFDPAAVDPARIAKLRAAWGLPAGAPVILLPARLTRWKGQGVLVQALAEIPGAVAVLAGDAQGRDAYVRELQELAAACGVAGRIRLPGHIADMPAALLAADLVIHASIEPEAFGRTVIEAQAMARLVIAADLGGPRETVEDGVTGWLTPPGDVPALAARIRAALALPASTRAAMGEAARLRVPSMEAMQSATIALYRELLD
ncbi:glycosyltransferase family 4 protein [Sediminicoccus sp. KRV36]|uniref:glycosyltransferase family 4 protein n=1 Tax=Sediminicoccus sp. KRV36 TaxID=3133721 RepID=UPI00200D32B6|nr:glycosyltransferase family 4 protein [Sediminicoccus rosea]UPY35546.1 glycosyltransferase family 4 protein [Sediminicoccus rosea]